MRSNDVDVARLDKGVRHLQALRRCTVGLHSGLVVLGIVVAGIEHRHSQSSFAHATIKYVEVTAGDLPCDWPKLALACHHGPSRQRRR